MPLRPSTRWMLALAACVALTPSADAQSTGRSEAAADTACSVYEAEPASTPAELAPFVTEGKQPLCAAAADLDGDGLRDYVLVLGTPAKFVDAPDEAEAEAAEGEAETYKDELRTLLVLLRGADGALRVAARSEHAVMCKGCGGMLGDPFEGVSAGPGTFTLYHYGGSAWRWRADYTFRYAPDSRRWRLGRVSSLSYWSLEPEKLEEHAYTAPEDFAAIDLAEFDYETWRRPGDEK